MGKKEEAPLASGVYAALATPRPQNSVEADAAALFDYLDLVQNRGVDGIVLFGSTGEFVHFDVTERMRVLMLAKKALPRSVARECGAFDSGGCDRASRRCHGRWRRRASVDASLLLPVTAAARLPSSTGSSAKKWMAKRGFTFTTFRNSQMPYRRK